MKQSISLACCWKRGTFKLCNTQHCACAALKGLLSCLFCHIEQPPPPPPPKKKKKKTFYQWFSFVANDPTSAQRLVLVLALLLWFREVTLQCKLKCHVGPLKFLLSFNPSEDMGGRIRRRKKSLTSAGIEPSNLRISSSFDIPTEQRGQTGGSWEQWTIKFRRLWLRLPLRSNILPRVELLTCK